MGCYICLEGVKGCGKTTLLDALRAMLDRQSVDWAAVSPTKACPAFSWAEFAAARVPVLRTIDRFNEYLYACRSNHAARRTNWHTPLLLGDRSIITSYVTRWHKWPDPERCIRRVNRMEWAIRPPDHVIYMQIDIRTALERIQGRRERTYGRQDETPRRLAENIQAYAAIMSGAHPIARLAGTRWHMIDAAQSRDAAYGECLETIQRIAPDVFDNGASARLYQSAPNRELPIDTQMVK
jgi:thymidylate kinase